MGDNKIRKSDGVAQTNYNAALVIDGSEKVYKAILKKDHSKGHIEIMMKKLTHTQISDNMSENRENMRILNDLHLQMMEDGLAWKKEFIGAKDTIKFPDDEEE